MEKVMELISKYPNKAIAFFSGDMAVTIWIFLGGLNIWSEIGDFGLKVAATIILGAAGGIAGIVGKELLYPRILKIFKKKKNK